MKTKNKLKQKKSKILEYALLALLTFFLIFPTKLAKYILIAIFVLWCIVIFFNDRKYFVNFFIKPHLVTYSVYIWVLFNFYVIFFTSILPFSINFLSVGFVLLLYLYYFKKNEKKGIYIIANVALFSIIIVNIITIRAVCFDHDISRLLSTSMKSELNYFGVGNYSFVYGLLFTTLSLLMVLIIEKGKLKYKLTTILIILLSIFCIYKTAFLIALIILVFGVILILLRVNTIKKLFLYLFFGLTTCFILVYSGIALKFFTCLSNNTDNHYFKSRFNDIALVLKKEDLENTDDLKIRFSVYEYSFKAFVNSPIAGMLNGNYLKNNKQAGGHSAILDEFARYGLIFSIPFFAMFIFVIMEIRKTFNSEKYRGCWFILVVCSCLLAFVNTMVFPTLIFMAFCISPSILLCCESLEKKGDNSDENNFLL